MASSENPFSAASNSERPDSNAEKFQGGMQHESRYKPNEQETSVLKECQRESFLYRALPGGLFAGTGTMVLIQRGILTTKTKLGPFPKVLFAGFLGYLLGKVSYISTCKQKFLKLENSPIAELLRKGASPGAIAARTQFGSPRENFGSQNDADSSVYTGGSGDTNKVVDDYSADLDIDSYSGQDVNIDSYDQSSMVGSEGDFVEKKRPEMTMTYDQLRKENREKTSKQYREVLPGQFQKRQSSDPPMQRPPVGRISSADDGFTLGRSKELRKNVYGDLISDE